MRKKRKKMSSKPTAAFNYLVNERGQLPRNVNRESKQDFSTLP